MGNRAVSALSEGGLGIIARGTARLTEVRERREQILATENGHRAGSRFFPNGSRPRRPAEFSRLGPFPVEPRQNSKLFVRLLAFTTPLSPDVRIFWIKSTPPRLIQFTPEDAPAPTNNLSPVLFYVDFLNSRDLRPQPPLPYWYYLTTPPFTRQSH